jgi:hypothetical protein
MLASLRHFAAEPLKLWRPLFTSFLLENSDLYLITKRCFCHLGSRNKKNITYRGVLFSQSLSNMLQMRGASDFYEEPYLDVR